jgi:uncharacterized Zn finger protein
MTGDCDFCGCNDVRIVRTAAICGRDTAVYRCGFCGRTWARSAPLEQVAALPVDPPARYDWPDADCPRCGRVGLVYKTEAQIRRVRCPGCGETYKVVGVARLPDPAAGQHMRRVAAGNGPGRDRVDPEP